MYLNINVFFFFGWKIDFDPSGMWLYMAALGVSGSDAYLINLKFACGIDTVAQ